MKGHQRYGNGGGPDNDGHEWQESNQLYVAIRPPCEAKKFRLWVKKN
jgi:hypothetical protein